MTAVKMSILYMDVSAKKRNLVIWHLPAGEIKDGRMEEQKESRMQEVLNC